MNREETKHEPESRHAGLPGLVLLACLLGPAGGLLAQPPATVIQGARVFTGDDVLEEATVLIRGRMIESVTLTPTFRLPLAPTRRSSTAPA